MARKGGLTKKFYRETRGLKVSGGQFVRSGTMITRKGDKWKAGSHVIGSMHLTAGCDGEVYFTKKRGKRFKAETYVHIQPAEQKILTKIRPVKKAQSKKEEKD